MKKYHILESLPLSFYSKPLYQDVAREWKGLALGYLLLVMAICWLPFSYDFHQFLNQYSTQILPGIIKQIPTITLSKGKLSIDKPVPYAIKQPVDEVTLIMFDTSGQYASLDHLNAFALITQDKAIVRDASGPVPKVTTYSFSKFQDTTITKSDIHYIADKIVFWSSVLMYPISIGIAFIYRLLQAVILAGIAFLVTGLFHIKLTYQSAIRLTIVALTPMLILTTFVEYFRFPIPFLSFISALLAIGYLAFAVYAQKEPEVNPSSTT